MNILELQDQLKNLPDNALVQEMKAPSGAAPQYLILGELQRRKDMRASAQGLGKAPQSTVADDLVRAVGTPPASPAQAPGMDGGIGALSGAVGTSPQVAAPVPANPQGYAFGGKVDWNTTLFGALPALYDKGVGGLSDFMKSEADPRNSWNPVRFLPGKEPDAVHQPAMPDLDQQLKNREDFFQKYHLNGYADGGIVDGMDAALYDPNSDEDADPYATDPDVQDTQDMTMLGIGSLLPQQTSQALSSPNALSNIAQNLATLQGDPAADAKETRANALTTLGLALASGDSPYFAQNLGKAGLAATSQIAASKAAQKKLALDQLKQNVALAKVAQSGQTKPTATQREYQQAVEQGFQGSLYDYQAAIRQAGRYPRGLQVVQSADGPVIFDPMTGATRPAIGPDGQPLRAKAPQIPPTIKKEIAQNRANLDQIDRAIDLLNKHPSAAGMSWGNAAAASGSQIGEKFSQWADPNGVPARAALANIGSLIIHDRSGAAVTVGEQPRLRPFIPAATDSKEVQLQKLDQLKQQISSQNEEILGLYPSDSGYQDLGDNRATTTSPQPGNALTVGTIQKGYRFMGGDPKNKENWEPAQ